MFKKLNKEDPVERNLVAKLNNTVTDLNFYCYRFLVKIGFSSTPRTGLNDALALISTNDLPDPVYAILNQYDKVKNATPKTANELFYSTWIFLHSFDKIFTMQYQTQFSKTQNQIDPQNSIRRQHAIPEDVYLFAVTAQINHKGPRGKGRSNVPTLPDIYYALAVEGLALVQSGEVHPTFKEVGRPEGCTFAQIVFELDVDKQLRELKERAEGGEFTVTPFKEISLISLVVTLIEVAIQARQPQKGTGSKKRNLATAS